MTRQQVRGYQRPQQRVGRRTGKSVHFMNWKAEGAVKSALQRLKTEHLADSLDGNLATAFALLSVGGVKNVWDLANADVEKLLKVRGIGPTRLELVEAYLKAKDVTVTWTVGPDGD